VLNHSLGTSETHLRLIVILGLEVFLGISSSAIKEVYHFCFLILKVVGVHLEFPLDLELLAFEGRVDSIG
jgi:hypothetical protein